MAISMYAVSVPLFTQMLGSLGAVLEKGEAFAAAKSVDPKVLAASRLACDMFPLSRQVQIATDMAKGAVCRLAGVEIPVYADTETDLAELRERIGKTLAFIATFRPAQIDGSEERDVTITLRRGDLHFKGERYLIHWAIPQILFHCTTAYDILRHNGVPIGKQDFVGAF
jgi:hypothetical protein